MTRMTKSWTIAPSNAPKGEPEELSKKLARYGDKPTPRQRKRLAKAAGKAIGRAMSYSGAARASAMRKLAGLPLENIVDEDTNLVLRDPKWNKKATAKKGTPADEQA